MIRRRKSTLATLAYTGVIAAGIAGIAAGGLGAAGTYGLDSLRQKAEDAGLFKRFIGNNFMSWISDGGKFSIIAHNNFDKEDIKRYYTNSALSAYSGTIVSLIGISGLFRARGY